MQCITLNSGCMYIISYKDSIPWVDTHTDLSAFYIYDRVKKYHRKKNQRIDYNAEIPFEKTPAPGFYDTSEETVENEGPDFKKMKRSDVDGVRRSAEEEVG